MKKIPAEIESTIDAVINMNGNASISNIPIRQLTHLVDFVVSNLNGGAAWQPKNRWKASAAAIGKVFDIPADELIAMNTTTNLPDATLYYGTLRYTDIINISDENKLFYDRSGRLKTNEIISTTYLATEATTPNIQSGACYNYTNIRTIIRANINGREMMFSISDMIGPSSFSTRGTVVGPKTNGVYYYSEKQGLNLTGATWAKSQLYVSKTLVVYAQVPDNKTAVAMFSWQSGGWKGMNIIRPFHIYAVLQDIFLFFSDVLCDPKVNINSATDIVNQVNKMSKFESNVWYSKYCDYIKKWRDIKQKGFLSIRKPVLSRIYNENSLHSMPEKYRKILIVQEKVRRLINRPTWSVMLPEYQLVNSRPLKTIKH